jgi:hypothetical protein
MGCNGGCNGSCGNLECGTGPAGLDGQNSFNFTTADFTQPAVGSTVTIDVSALGQMTGLFAKVGQVIFVEGGGYYEVVSSTTTTIELENLGYTGNALPTSTVSFPAGVSPAGLVGPQGPAGANGSAGADGTSQLVTGYFATAATGTSFSPLHTAQTLPSTSGDLLFPSTGSILRIHLAAVLAAVSGNSSSDYWKGDIEIVLDGTTIVLPISSPFLSTRSYAPFNGMTAIVDIVAISLSPLTIIADVKAFETGFGAYSGTSGYLVLPTSANSPSHFGNPFASGQTTGVNQSSDVVLQVNGRRTSVGSPSGAPSLFLPMLKVERLLK